MGDLLNYQFRSRKVKPPVNGVVVAIHLAAERTRLFEESRVTGRYSIAASGQRNHKETNNFRRSRSYDLSAPGTGFCVTGADTVGPGEFSVMIKFVAVDEELEAGSSDETDVCVARQQDSSDESSAGLADVVLPRHMGHESRGPVHGRVVHGEEQRFINSRFDEAMWSRMTITSSARNRQICAIIV